jgi:hypothetical protein
VFLTSDKKPEGLAQMLDVTGGKEHTVARLANRGLIGDGLVG